MRITIKCCDCGKNLSSSDEIGINKKLLGLDISEFYCLTCLANYLEVSEQDVLDKIDEFKEEGCTLFD